MFVGANIWNIVARLVSEVIGGRIFDGPRVNCRAVRLQVGIETIYKWIHQTSQNITKIVQARAGYHITKANIIDE